MIDFFKYSNTEGKVLFIWAMICALCLIAGIFNRCFLIGGIVILALGFVMCLMYLPEAQFGKDDPPDENALL